MMDAQRYTVCKYAPKPRYCISMLLKIKHQELGVTLAQAFIVNREKNILINERKTSKYHQIMNMDPTRRIPKRYPSQNNLIDVWDEPVVHPFRPLLPDAPKFHAQPTIFSINPKPQIANEEPPPRSIRVPNCLAEDTVSQQPHRTLLPPGALVVERQDVANALER